MKPREIRLFIKPFCGWCDEAVDWLDQHGLDYQKLDVIADGRARGEMVRLSGQSLAPVIDVDGEVLADFDVDQLAAWWKEHGFEFA